MDRDVHQVRVGRFKLQFVAESGVSSANHCADAQREPSKRYRGHQML